MLSKNGDIMSFDFRIDELHEAFKKFYGFFLHDDKEEYQSVLATKCNSRGVTLKDLLFSSVYIQNWQFYVGNNKVATLIPEKYGIDEKQEGCHYIDLPYLEYDFEDEKMFLADLVDLYESAKEHASAVEEIQTNHECAYTYYCTEKHAEKAAGVFDRENCETRVNYWLEAINLNTPAWKKKIADALENYMRQVHKDDINNLNIFELVFVETHVDSWWTLRDTTHLGSGVTITL